MTEPHRNLKCKTKDVHGTIIKTNKFAYKVMFSLTSQTTNFLNLNDYNPVEILSQKQR